MGVPSDIDEGVTALTALLTSETAPEAAEALGSVLERWIETLLASEAPIKKVTDTVAAVVRGRGLVPVGARVCVFVAVRD